MYKMNSFCEIGSKEEDFRRGPWTIEEDNLLIQSIKFNGEGRWNSLAKYSGLKRTGKSCRLRWLNYLKPDIKQGSLTPHEQLLILELHFKLGNRWSKIAQHLPGRTDNGIKNYWRTRVQKQARQLNLDSDSHKFLEAVKMFWEPRLREKIEQDDLSSPRETTTLETQKSGSSYPNLDSLETSISGNNSSGEMIIQLPGHECPTPANSTTNTQDFQFGSSIEDDYCNSYCYCDAICPDYYFDVALPECHVSEADRLEENTSWDTDELWQFGKF